jgi:hypothetical protein
MMDCAIAMRACLPILITLLAPVATVVDLAHLTVVATVAAQAHLTAAQAHLAAAQAPPVDLQLVDHPAVAKAQAIVNLRQAPKPTVRHPVVTALLHLLQARAVVLVAAQAILVVNLQLLEIRLHPPMTLEAALVA